MIIPYDFLEADADIDKIDINLLLHSGAPNNITMQLTSTTHMAHSNLYADLFPNFGITIYPEKIEF